MYQPRKGRSKISKQENNSLLQGQIIAVYRERYLVEYEERRIFMEVSGRFKYLNYQKSDYPQIGDYVLFHLSGEELGIIEGITERSKILERMDVGTIGERHILAVNVDIVFICMSLNEDFNIRKLRNYLNLTYNHEYRVIILLTKKDLCDNIESYTNEVQQVTEYEVLSVSSFNDDDVDLLKSIISDSTAVLIGSSGVGKSSLINKMIGSEYLETKTIRLADAQGRHTTVNRELIHLPTGGKVIDTPGIRIVSSFYVDEESFEDILSLSEGCMFSDCTHTSEPGCMVQKGINDGTLDSERYKQYVKAMRLNLFNQKRELQRQRLLEKKMRKGR